MESRDGFVALPTLFSPSAAGSPSGPTGEAQRERDQRRCPAESAQSKRLLWSHTMTGPGMSGLAVSDGCLLAADKSGDESDDVFRCLDADTGKQLLETNLPRSRRDGLHELPPGQSRDSPGSGLSARRLWPSALCGARNG